MPFADPPRCAAFLRAGADGCRVDGNTAAVEHGKTWAVRYGIAVRAA